MRLLLLLCLTLLAAPLAAQEGAWTRIGPDGGDITALAAAPSRPALLYAATQNGSVFRSLDRGETWSFAGWPNTPLADLAVDPRTPNLVYGAALFVILRSTDGGASWAEVQRGGLVNPIRGVEVNPHNGIAFGLSAETLWRSDDRGVTWKTGRHWPGHVQALAFDPKRPGVVWAGAQDGLFRSANGGHTWQPWGRGLPAEAAIGSLAVDPHSPRTLWAGLSNGQGGVYKSTDGGATWALSRRGLLNRYVQNLLADPAGSQVLFANTSGELFRSTNGGAAWARVGNGLRSDVTDLDATPYGILAGTRSGVSLSTDRGLTWRDRQRGLTSLWITGLAIDTQSPPRLYAGDGLAGTFKTRDRGASWLRLGEVENPLHWDRRLMVDPAVPDTVYTTATSAIAKSTNGGRLWEAHGALSCGIADALILDPREPSTLYTSGFILSIGCAQLPDTCLMARSRDAGESWSCIAEGLESPYGTAVLAVDPFTSAVYAQGGGLLRSTDHGDTWTPLAPGLDIHAFAVSSRTPGTLYAARQESVGRSLDGGLTWSIFTYLSPQNTSIVGLAIDPNDDAIVYAGTAMGQGVFRSTDGGATWTPLGTWPGWSVRSGPVLDPVDPSIVYVGTGEAGVLRYDTNAN